MRRKPAAWAARITPARLLLITGVGPPAWPTTRVCRRAAAGPIGEVDMRGVISFCRCAGRLAAEAAATSPQPAYAGWRPGTTGRPVRTRAGDGAPVLRPCPRLKRLWERAPPAQYSLHDQARDRDPPARQALRGQSPLPQPELTT